MDNEQTINQSEVTESNDSDDLFLADELSEEQAEPTAETHEDAPFMTIKYNGADENLSKEDAITLAQKGKNYDKIYSRLQEYENDPTRKVFSEQARRAGLTLEEYADRLSQFQDKSEIRRIASDFMEAHPDVDEDVANEYAEAQFKNQLIEKQQAEARQSEQMAQARQNKAMEQVEAFMKEFPDVDIQKLPQEVIRDIDENGETLLSAYRAYAYKQARNEIASLRQNRYNESKAVGSLSENKGATDGGDPFLSGLLG